MKQIGSIEKNRKFSAKFDNTFVDKCWLCRNTFMVNFPLVATGDRVAHPGSGVSQVP
jgi:hypothetical protein